MTMFNFACAIVTIICFVFSGVCVHRCKAAECDRDEYRERWIKTVNDLGRAIELNDRVIEITKKVNNKSEQLITYNNRLTDINADLRLELNKLKDNENQIHKYGGYVELTGEITDA